MNNSAVQTKILLIDDHPAVLAGLKSLLGKQKDVSIIAMFSSGKAALDWLSQNDAADIIFLDINLPEINGYELCKIIKKKYAAVKIIALSTFYERSNITRMIQNGASGYLSKTAGTDEMLEAITTVMKNDLYLGEDIKKELFNTDKETIKKEIPKLTRREKQILAFIAEGKTNAQIADEIFLSILTVETHRKNMMAKLEVNNMAALIKTAIENGLI